MKYETIIETDDYKDFEFFEDGNGKYIHGTDAGAVNNEWIALYFKECKQEPSCDDKGEISDGYHTFNQLYHQRAILFATIINQNTDIAWKSYKHSDGKYCFDSNGEWFIVGIDTPEGSYTYHYSKEYWDYFKCKELGCGKEWDGHTEEDVTRLLSLKPCEDAISRQAVLDLVVANHTELNGVNVVMYSPLCKDIKQLPPVNLQEPKIGHWIYICNSEVNGLKIVKCSECGKRTYGSGKYCPNCGAEMAESEDI